MLLPRPCRCFWWLGGESFITKRAFSEGSSLLDWCCRRMGRAPLPMGSPGSILASRAHRGDWTMPAWWLLWCRPGIGSWAIPTPFAPGKAPRLLAPCSQAPGKAKPHRRGLGVLLGTV